MHTWLACVALALALVAVPAIVLAGGAGTADGGPDTAATTVDTDDIDGAEVSLSPAPGSNGQYAELNGDDDELALRFDELNDNATTTAHDVFAIDVTAAEPVAVRVEDDAPGVSFYWSDDPTADANESRTVQSGENVTVGVQLDSPDAIGGNFTVVAESVSDEGGGGGFTPPPADGGSLTVIDADVSPAEIAVGGSATATATVANSGSSSATDAIELSIDGTVVDQRTVTVAGGETETVAFDRTFQQTGEFAVAVGGVDAGTVTARAGDEGRSGFAVSNASLSPSSIQPGESTTVTANVTNRDGTAGVFTAELSVGGVVVEQRSVRVAPGATEQVSFERTFQRRGGYDVAVSGESAGTLRVESSRAVSMRRYGSEWGWLLGAASVPTLGGAFVAARRRQRLVQDD